jgi:hypothetical protein
MSFELEPSRHPVAKASDTRRRLEEPLPVELEAVADLHVPVPKALQKDMLRLYGEMLQFAAMPAEPHLAFRADNFILRFDLPRSDKPNYHPIRIIIPSLPVFEAQLSEAGIEYTRQRGLLPGEEVTVLLDPDGNWLEVHERKDIAG